MIKSFLKKLADTFGYIVLKKGYPIDIQREKDFIEKYEQVLPYTMVASDKAFGLYQALQYIIRHKIEGDFVECGVWRGGQAMLMASVLQQQNDTGRTLWLYDTYAGMSEPTPEDVFVYPEDPAAKRWKDMARQGHNEWCYASLDEVKRNMRQTGYPEENARFVKGKVEDTLPKEIPQKIALLRLDTDWYVSTKHELEHLFPLLVSGGVLILDDYGSWEGARQAVDEYFATHKDKILLVKVGQSRIGVKL
jgi:O-methyltransferase